MFSMIEKSQESRSRHKDTRGANLFKAIIYCAFFWSFFLFIDPVNRACRNKHVHAHAHTEETSRSRPFIQSFHERGPCRDAARQRHRH